MTALHETKVAQVGSELSAFIELLKAENVRSYLEIGSQFGGSLWRVANALPKGSRIVSVDLPWGDRSTERHLVSCCAKLVTLGYDVHLITDDSTRNSTVYSATKMPFDAIFIDGNHTLPYVTKDWENYGPHGRIVAFHDIAWDRPVRPGRLPIEVSTLWRSIKDQYRHQEFIAPGSEKGIGILWR